MKNTKIQNKALSKDSLFTIFLFVALLSIFYFGGYWLIFRLERATPLMLTVGIATIVTLIIRGRKLSTLGWHWGNWQYQRVSYLVPLFIISTSYLIIWISGQGEWYDSEFVSKLKKNYNLQEWQDLTVIILHICISASLTFLAALPSVLGEEIGWRGFLVPELTKIFSFTAVALISSLLWAAWHWPLIYFGLYGNSETPFSYQLFFFTLFIVSNGIIMAYLQIKTGSLWTGVIYHMSSNVFMQKVFTPLTRKNEGSAWYVDEFGAIPAIVASLFAFYFWRRGEREFAKKN